MLCLVAEGDAVFTVKLQDYTVTEKDEVTLDCELSKDVPVMWYHSEKELITSKMVLMKSEGLRRVLVLKKVEEKDKGQYVCDCGTDKTMAKVIIEGKSISWNNFTDPPPHYSKETLMFYICMFVYLSPAARDIKVVRPLYGVEVFDGETARFEVEISEDDVHGQWKLNGEVLSPSSVSFQPGD